MEVGDIFKMDNSEYRRYYEILGIAHLKEYIKHLKEHHPGVDRFAWDIHTQRILMNDEINADPQTVFCKLSVFNGKSFSICRQYKKSRGLFHFEKYHPWSIDRVGIPEISILSAENKAIFIKHVA